MARVSATVEGTERDSTRTLVSIGVVVAALYFGSEILVPVALAILLSFVLAPAVRKLHAWGLGRVFPVLITTTLAFCIIFSLAGLMASQLKDVATDLPRYEDTMTKKVAALKGVTSGGVLEKLEEVVSKLSKAMNRSGPAAQSSPTGQDLAPAPRQSAPSATDANETRQPVPVEIRQPPPSPFDALSSVLAPLAHSFATAGIVVIFVVFILLQREDLRNRLIRLFGAGDLQRTTAAIDDAAKRLSRYLLTQSLVNTTAGLIVGLAAWIIGVPNPILWGILFGCLRFVPYIGPVIGGLLPVVFAAVVSPGWSLALWMGGVVVAAELIIGQVVEPLLYGHNTGLSPVAIVVSATFWTALWGPVGLLLATPMTVCLVVVGRHVEHLAFLDVLLGDRPPLSAPETFYQRMLANDPTEVADQAEECLKEKSLSDYYDDVVLPGLLLAQEDVAAERLTVERQVQIRDATVEVIDDLGEENTHPQHHRWTILGRGRTAGQDHSINPADKAEVAPGWKRDGAVVCIGARSPLDDCPAEMLAQILVRRGIGARAESHEMLSKAHIDELDMAQTRLVCLSCLDGSSSAYLRFALRRVRRRAPRAKILVGAWWLQTTDEADPPEDLSSDRAFSEPSASTIVDAARFCLAAASVLDEDELTTDESEQATEKPAA